MNEGCGDRLPLISSGQSAAKFSVVTTSWSSTVGKCGTTPGHGASAPLTSTYSMRVAPTSRARAMIPSGPCPNAETGNSTHAAAESESERATISPARSPLSGTATISNPNGGPTGWRP